MTTTKRDDLERPEGLSEKGNAAYYAIRYFLKEKHLEGTGGCKAFYSPAEWAARRERYGAKSELVIVYDGGDVGDAFSHDRECYGLIDQLATRLRELGLYSEECTGWYSAVYKI